MHPLAKGFGSVADHYERGRPEYAPAVAGVIMAELGLAPGALVLDLAAGTGKLTRTLLAAGLEVVAVEPQAEMREPLVGHIGEARVREGFAEAIPLEDDSVRAVTVSDAFHWFDHAAALREIERVLEPGGGLAVIFTTPDWSGASWAHELGSLIVSLRPEHPAFDGPSWQEAVRASGHWSEVRELRLSVPQKADPERVVDHVASISWIASLPPDRLASTIEQVRKIVSSGETPAEMPLRAAIGLTHLL